MIKQAGSGCRHTHILIQASARKRPSETLTSPKLQNEGNTTYLRRLMVTHVLHLAPFLNIRAPEMLAITI